MGIIELESELWNRYVRIWESRVPNPKKSNSRQPECEVGGSRCISRDFSNIDGIRPSIFGMMKQM